MDIEKVKEVARNCMEKRQETREREPGWLFHHGHRVARIALRLAEELGASVDPDILHAGALFHDIGKGVELHNECGAATTREMLKELCTSTELDAVCDIVQYHNQREQTLQFCEAVRIVQDADVLDHVGAISPWLAFFWSGMHNQSFHDLIRFIEGEENTTTQIHMRAGLNFDVSRRIFDERLSFEESFFSEVKRIYLDGI